MTEPQEHDVVRRYVQGASINLLALDLGVSRTMIRRVLRVAGVLRESDGRKNNLPRHSPTPEEIAEITEKIREGKVPGIPGWTKEEEIRRMGAYAPRPVSLSPVHCLGIERQGTSTSRGSGG